MLKNCALHSQDCDEKNPDFLSDNYKYIGKSCQNYPLYVRSEELVKIRYISGIVIYWETLVKRQGSYTDKKI